MPEIDGSAPALVIAACFVVFMIIFGFFWSAYSVVGYIRTRAVVQTMDVEARTNTSPTSESDRSEKEGIVTVPGTGPITLLVTPASPAKNKAFSRETREGEEEQTGRKALESIGITQTYHPASERPSSHPYLNPPLAGHPSTAFSTPASVRITDSLPLLPIATPSQDDMPPPTPVDQTTLTRRLALYAAGALEP
ncbi:hypothetical protein OE88DRAFT_1732555 [Heliocybe sulcata]|uniref:Transmembrane protein n=1 Tax=Heliocybe sulcata TaxID=5364 RepID=A0A5C3NGY2_9AGAM|nr:hypothetical protein OE88DRAFT_1732555 [Heliocybe sulcata]